MKTFTLLLFLTFIIAAGINWLWGVAAFMVWFFVELVQFLFTPKKL